MVVVLVIKMVVKNKYTRAHRLPLGIRVGEEVKWVPSGKAFKSAPMPHNGEDVECKKIYRKHTRTWMHTRAQTHIIC